MAFGDLLRTARKKKGLDQDELSDAVFEKTGERVSRFTIIKWEGGRVHDAQIPKVRAVAQTLNLDVEEVVRELLDYQPSPIKSAPQLVGWLNGRLSEIENHFQPFLNAAIQEEANRLLEARWAEYRDQQIQELYQGWQASAPAQEVAPTLEIVPEVERAPSVLRQAVSQLHGPAPHQGPPDATSARPRKGPQAPSRKSKTRGRKTNQ